MPEPLRTANRGLTAPASGAFAVTPNDGNDLSPPARAIYVGGGGDLAVVTLDNSTVVFRSVGGGTVLPVSALRIRSTGTSASAIVALT